MYDIHLQCDIHLQDITKKKIAVKERFCLAFYCSFYVIFPLSTIFCVIFICLFCWKVLLSRYAVPVSSLVLVGYGMLRYYICHSVPAHTDKGRTSEGLGRGGGREGRKREGEGGLVEGFRPQFPVRRAFFFFYSLWFLSEVSRALSLTNFLNFHL